MPTSIQDLPFELLERILVYAVPRYDPDSPRTLTSRQTFLRDCSLVSRQFRCPSQAVLWSVVRVHATATAKRLLSSPVLGMYGSHHVDLAGVHAGSEGLSGTVAGRVLAKVRGVQILRLSDFGRLSARVLQNESLTGLRTLDLMTSFPDKASVIAALHVPFHLRELRLFNRSYGTTILPVLFHTCAHSLISLTVSMGPGSPSYTSLLDGFPLIAPNLVHFSLQHRPSPAFTDLLGLLTRLAVLECNFAVDLATTLDALPATSNLRVLVIELDFNLQQAAAILLARLEQPVLAGLKTLRIPRAPHRDEFREFGGEGLLERCEARGIAVEIGQTVAWRTRLFP
ncbi:hypothetical protein JCM10908_006946 [Rhodotorula pacifica]|uniref:uncharacterized protein n=1 Tax=Rhodotorula pacifica TaxID=1495444 RepID=UPI00317CE8CB